MSDTDHASRSNTDSFATGWFYSAGDESIGPRSKAEVLQHLATNPSEGVFVWHPDLTDWTPVERSIFNTVPAVRPPPPLHRVTMPAAHQQEVGFWGSLFSFRGRIGRLHYLVTYVVVISIYVALVFAALGVLQQSIDSPDALIIRLLIALPFIWIGLAVTAKRLHDFDLGAVHLLWVATVDFLPSVAPTPISQVGTSLASLCMSLVLILKRGSSAANRFGPNPFASPLQPSSGVAVAPKTHPVRTAVLVTVGMFVLITASALGLAGLMSATVPACSDSGAGEKVKQLVANNNQNDVTAVFAGGVQNLLFTLRDARTLSDSEPPHGRTCVATVAVRAKSGNPLLGPGELGSQEVTYTIQNVDGQSGRYVVSVLR